MTGTRPHRALLVCAVLAACGTAEPRVDDPQATIAAALERAAADWNRGDLAGFMSDYAPDSTTSFVSGRGVTYGWQTVHDRYRATYFASGKTRDSLAFDALRVRLLAPTIALATGHFAMLRGDSVTSSGPFTLVLEHRDGRWLILHDHTSSDPKP